MQSEHGISVKGSGLRPSERLRESTATRVVNASGRQITIAVLVMLLAFAISAVSTLLVIFTRDLKAKEAGSVVAQSTFGGNVDYLTDQRGTPVASGTTLFQFDLVSPDSTIPAAAQNLVDFNVDPNARLGVFGNRGHVQAFLATIDTVNIGMGSVDAPVSFGYRVNGFMTRKNHVTLKMNGATGDLDLHLIKEDDGTVRATIGDENYIGDGFMNDGVTECKREGNDKNKKVVGPDGIEDCDWPLMSAQEAKVCSASPDVVCAERRAICNVWGQCQMPSRLAPRGRMLEEEKPQRRRMCATCVAVGVAVAGGAASGIAGGVTNHVLNNGR